MINGRKVTRLAQVGVGACPQSGGGVHRWVYRAACCCRDAGLQAVHAISLIEAEISRAPQPPSEVHQTVANVYGSEPRDKAERFPTRDLTAIRRIVEGGPSLAELSAVSPVRNAKQADVFRGLFKAGELVCTGARLDSPSIWVMSSTSLHEIAAQFVVPSPMAARVGVTKDGRRSLRSLSNVGPRRWLVVECDFQPGDVREIGASSTFDACASVLKHLSDFRPLVLAVVSGGKSVHGWFPVLAGEDETPGTSDLWRFMAYAVKIGADPQTWCRCQWVRCPGGTRRDESGRAVKQEIAFFDQTTAEVHLE